MRVAQRLYENGYITYMRTDSTSLSETALTAARQQARDMYGAGMSPTHRGVTARCKGAQEAHGRSAPRATASGPRPRLLVSCGATSSPSTT